MTSIQLSSAVESDHHTCASLSLQNPCGPQFPCAIALLHIPGRMNTYCWCVQRTCAGGVHLVSSCTFALLIWELAYHDQQRQASTKLMITYNRLIPILQSHRHNIHLTSSSQMPLVALQTTGLQAAAVELYLCLSADAQLAEAAAAASDLQA